MNNTELLQQLNVNLKSFEDACKIEGVDPHKVIPDFEFFPNRDKEAMRQLSQLVIIIRAANRIANGGEEWIPDYQMEQHKWMPVFEIYGPGGCSGFESSAEVQWVFFSSVGSRLCYINWHVAQYVADTFYEKYKSFFVIDTKKKGLPFSRNEITKSINERNN